MRRGKQWTVTMNSAGKGLLGSRGAARACQTTAGLAVAWAVLLGAAFLAPRLFPRDDPADVVTRQTARVAVLYWAVAAGALLLQRREFARWAWSLGAAAFCVHVVTAFDQVHGWSHAAAARHVEAVTGFGPGLFVSYAFTGLWVLDAAWWAAAPAGYDARPLWLDWAVHGFVAFVVFNGTIVYESGLIRWAGALAFVALGVLAARRLARRER